MQSVKKGAHNSNLLELNLQKYWIAFRQIVLKIVYHFSHMRFIF